eukprot:4610317-Alexandrium_andersonii.AAC.1
MSTPAMLCAIDMVDGDYCKHKGASKPQQHKIATFKSAVLQSAGRAVLGSWRAKAEANDPSST